MKIAIYGAGAIGAHLGAMLARTEHEVSLIARGPHLKAMQDNGLTFRSAEEQFTVHPNATDDPASLGPQDYVIVTLKAHQSGGVVDLMKPLMGPETAVVTCMNGVPWWYFHGLGGEHEGRTLETVDPGAKQWRGLGPERVIGCIPYPATEIVEPGVCQHLEGNTYSLGEPTGERSDRAKALSQALIAGGLRAPVRTAIRDELWVKLWGNLCFNPISALTHATLEDIGTDPGVREVVVKMMQEAQAVGEALGAKFKVSLEKRIAGAVGVGAHKTSMLQDLERGRPMEIDALVTSIAELGDIVGLDTPMLDAVLALVQLRARTAGLYPTS